MAFSSNKIKDNCQSEYYINNIAIKPVVLDGRNEIILAYWLNKKSIECT